MAAYVGLIQRKEREIGCDVLTHQKWSGAEYVDGLLKTVTAAMGKVSHLETETSLQDGL